MISDNTGRTGEEDEDGRRAPAPPPVLLHHPSPVHPGSVAAAAAAAVAAAAAAAAARAPPLLPRQSHAVVVDDEDDEETGDGVEIRHTTGPSTSSSLVDHASVMMTVVTAPPPPRLSSPPTSTAPTITTTAATTITTSSVLLVPDLHHQHHRSSFLPHSHHHHHHHQQQQQQPHPPPPSHHHHHHSPQHQPHQSPVVLVPRARSLCSYDPGPSTSSVLSQQQLRSEPPTTIPLASFLHGAGGANPSSSGSGLLQAIQQQQQQQQHGGGGGVIKAASFDASTLRRDFPPVTAAGPLDPTAAVVAAAARGLLLQHINRALQTPTSSAPPPSLQSHFQPQQPSTSTSMLLLRRAGIKGECTDADDDDPTTIVSGGASGMAGAGSAIDAAAAGGGAEEPDENGNANNNQAGLPNLQVAAVVDSALQQLHQLSSDSAYSSSTATATTTTTATDSSASLSGGGSNAAALPPKSVIQEDVRRQGGRFQLVRKRGRSEVWNLFGQVLDTLTDSRLPYVACYACKVLYTDTGGGTGNMTRHRCPMGTSYRQQYRNQQQHSSTSSTSKTKPQSMSIDESQPRSASIDPSSSSVAADSGDLAAALAAAAAAAAATIDHHHHHHHHSMERCSSLSPPPTQLPLPLVTIQPPPPAAPTSFDHLQRLFLQQQQQQQQQNHLDAKIQQSTTPLAHQSSAEAALGDAERDAFVEAVVRCCALDLLHPRTFENRGFRMIFDRATAAAVRRSGSSGAAAGTTTAATTVFSRQPSVCAADFMPDTQTIYQQIDVFWRAARDDQKAELADCGARCALAVERLNYGSKPVLVTWCAYVAPDWTHRRAVLRVTDADQTSAAAEIETAAAEYGLSNQLDQLLVVAMNDAKDAASLRELSLPDVSVHALVDAQTALNQVMDRVLRDARVLEQLDTPALVAEFRKVAEALEPGDELWELAEALADNNNDLDVEDWTGASYALLAAVREQRLRVENALERRAETQHLAEFLVSVPWTLVEDVERLLDAVHETAAAFADPTRPTIHTVLPEWHALMHELHVDDTGSVSPTMTAFGGLLRKVAESAMRSTAEKVLSDWHRMATVLNPRLRHLPVIATERQRAATYARLRELAGIVGRPGPAASTASSSSASEETGSSTGMSNAGGEPSRKRRHFLSALEEATESDDELDCYLRTQFSNAQTRDLLAFWSGAGGAQFPRLAAFARSLLATPAVTPRTPLERATATAPRHVLPALLALRTLFAQESHPHHQHHHTHHHHPPPSQVPSTDEPTH